MRGEGIYGGGIHLVRERIPPLRPEAHAREFYKTWNPYLGIVALTLTGVSAALW